MLEDALVVARPDLPVLLALNPTAALLWPYFASKKSVSSAAELLCHHFAIPFDQAKSDSAQTFRTFKDFVDAPIPRPLTPAGFRSDTTVFSATYSINKVPIRLNLTTDEEVNELSPRLAALCISDTPVGHTFTLCEGPGVVSIYCNGTHFGTEPLLTGARAILLQEFTRLAAPGREFSAILHAGACGNSRACIILAGPSFSGKSTFCAAMIARGFLCYSDDSACLTSDQQLAGMPFALALREGERFRSSNLNGESPTSSPGAIVFVNYQANEPTAFKPVGAFEAFVELQKSGFWVAHTEPSIANFLRWLQVTPRYKLTYSRMSEAIAIVEPLI